MNRPLTEEKAEFDAYAATYDDTLARGISISGEDKNYFARRRIVWLSCLLNRLQEQPRTAMDFGCGTGSAIPFLLNELELESVVGVDASNQSLMIARDIHGAPARFVSLAEHRPKGDFDLAFCNGVFHHISPGDRAAAVDTVYSSLRPGGLFAFWENNPWNPGARYVMRRIPFDRSAITLSPPVARRMLCERGFEVLRTDFLFLFPRSLSWLRCLEPCMSSLPFGAQYEILCRKPDSIR
jgi:SAM-dependent methyltransferase